MAFGSISQDSELLRQRTIGAVDREIETQKAKFAIQKDRQENQYIGKVLADFEQSSTPPTGVVEGGIEHRQKLYDATRTAISRLLPFGQKGQVVAQRVLAGVDTYAKLFPIRQMRAKTEFEAWQEQNPGGKVEDFEKSKHAPRAAQPHLIQFDNTATGNREAVGIDASAMRETGRLPLGKIPPTAGERTAAAKGSQDFLHIFDVNEAGDIVGLKAGAKTKDVLIARKGVDDAIKEQEKILNESSKSEVGTIFLSQFEGESDAEFEARKEQIAKSHQKRFVDARSEIEKLKKQKELIGKSLAKQAGTAKGSSSTLPPKNTGETKEQYIARIKGLGYTIK